MSLPASRLADPPPETGKRDFARARLNLAARLVTFSGSYPCTLMDLSCSGAQLAAANSPRVGAMVVVEGLPLELFGAVRWATGGLFGFQFEVPLPVDTVVAMRRYADDTEGRRLRERMSYARNWVTGVPDPAR